MGTDESFKRSGSVPFKWEIQPGIPKPAADSSCYTPEATPPQLRPPPSGFYFSEFKTQPEPATTTRSHSRGRLFNVLNLMQSTSFSSSGCFLPPLVDKKKINKFECCLENDSKSWSQCSSNSTQKSSSPLSPSPSQLSSPHSAVDAKWAAFGLF
ncbi:hypothetical protein FRX31_033126 [Thalictrum thalictroides]|uniref:Uncharacterized protein n=1 Tax=Thalictrum thalictroides TaxID=46969 RepID=A0A7J6UXE4_THATH|nr:hypothetical protein FRX31_033126 [Thalictrum thalictroides]